MRCGALYFNGVTVTSVVLLAYILALFLVFGEDVLPGVPKEHGLSLEDAYLNLHHASVFVIDSLADADEM